MTHSLGSTTQTHIHIHLHIKQQVRSDVQLFVTVKLLMPSEKAPICLTVPSESSIWIKNNAKKNKAIAMLVINCH